MESTNNEENYLKHLGPFRIITTDDLYQKQRGTSSNWGNCSTFGRIQEFGEESHS